MARYETTCSKCRNTVVVVFGQRVLGGELIYSGSQHCRSCGSALEFDGAGDLPEDLEKLIVADEGWWKLEVSPSGRVGAMRLFRARLGLSIADAKKALDGLCGTKTKLEWLQQDLKRRGIASVISRTQSQQSREH